MKRIMIVDDHTLVRETLAAALDAEPDLEVVAGCVDAGYAVQLAEGLHPDVIVMDLQMPGMDGAHATREILRRDPGVTVLMLTGAPDGRLATKALAAGARACIAKSMDVASLIAAIREA